MFSMHECPEGKSIFECPFEEHRLPSPNACDGCTYYLIDDSGYHNCCSDDGTPILLDDLDECPEGNTPEYCSYGEECRVGEPITIDDMLKLNE